METNETTIETIKKQKKKKISYSRAARCGREVDSFREVASNLEDIKTEIESVENLEDLKGLIGKANEEIQKVDPCEIEELYNELENWKDNLPENLQYGSKTDQLEEAMQILEDGKNYLEDIEEIETEEDTEETNEDFEELKQDAIEKIEEVIENIENGCDELEGVEFPGMFG